MNPRAPLSLLKPGTHLARVALVLAQPLTATQAAKRSGLKRSRCSEALASLKRRGLADCHNAAARQGRVYSLTAKGTRVRKALDAGARLTTTDHCFETVDWVVYGRLCHRHRTAVILAMTEPLQPSIIKRRARIRNCDLRMSANNVRDVMRLFLAWGVAKPLRIRRKAHLRYELTEQGKLFQKLLQQAEVRP